SPATLSAYLDTPSLHDALPILAACSPLTPTLSRRPSMRCIVFVSAGGGRGGWKHCSNQTIGMFGDILEGKMALALLCHASAAGKERGQFAISGNIGGIQNDTGWGRHSCLPGLIFFGRQECLP